MSKALSPLPTTVCKALVEDRLFDMQIECVNKTARSGNITTAANFLSWMVANNSVNRHSPFDRSIIIGETAFPLVDPLLKYPPQDYEKQQIALNQACALILTCQDAFCDSPILRTRLALKELEWIEEISNKGGRIGTIHLMIDHIRNNFQAGFKEHSTMKSFKTNASEHFLGIKNSGRPLEELVKTGISEEDLPFADAVLQAVASEGNHKESNSFHSVAVTRE